MKKLIPVYLIVPIFLALSGCDNPAMKDILQAKTITFDSKGGSRVPSQTVYRNQRIIEPLPPPAKDGYDFNGWYTDDETFDIIWFFEEMPQGDMTLYARWTGGDNPQPPDTIAFEQSDMVKTYGDDAFTNSIKSGYKGTIVYYTSNPDVASVDISTGKVTIHSAGEARIMAGRDEGEDYAKAEAGYILTVNPKQITLSVSLPTPSSALSPLNSTVPITVSISGIVGNDTIEISLNSSSGLSLGGDTPIGNSGTMTLNYNGTTTVETPNVIVPLTISDSNYTLSAGSGSVTVTILDGQASDRAIPVTDGNIKTFNTYANTSLGLLRHYELKKDISLDAPTTGGTETISNWTAIGTQGPFTGSFDGGGNTITNLTINNTTDKNQGMFASVGTDGTVKNLELVNCNVTGIDYVGGVVGANSGTVEKCFVTGSSTVTGTGTGTIGGSDTVTTSDAGGVVGSNNGTVEKCYSTGTVKGTRSAGGVVGDNKKTITNCYYAGGTVEGTYYGYSIYAGGVVGSNSGTVQYCYATGIVTNLEASNCTGGVVGVNYGTVKNCVGLNDNLQNNNDPNYYGRVVGFNSSNGTTLANNYGKSDMQVNDNSFTWSPNDIGLDKKNGESVVSGQQGYGIMTWWSEQDQNRWNTAPWDFDKTWTWPADNSQLQLPTLQ